MAFAILSLIAIFGAWFSKKIKFGGSVGSMALMMSVFIISSAAWIVISKYTKMSLVPATVVFDILISVSYFAAFMAFGEQVTYSQWIGVALAIMGIF